MLEILLKPSGMGGFAAQIQTRLLVLYMSIYPEIITPKTPLHPVLASIVHTFDVIFAERCVSWTSAPKISYHTSEIGTLRGGIISPAGRTIKTGPPQSIVRHATTPLLIVFDTWLCLILPRPRSLVSEGWNEKKELEQCLGA